MSIYRETLLDELERNLNSQKAFQNRYDGLRKGSICKKNIRNCEYYYLKYREGKKTITEYIGPVHSIKITPIEKELEKAKSCKKTLIELKKNEIKLRKAIEVL